MAKDNQILVRVNDPLNDSIEQFAEDRDYNKAEAVRRITESRLRSEGYLSKQIYGDGEPEPVADGGQIIRPIVQNMNAISTIFSLISVFLFFSHLVVDIPLISPINAVGFTFVSVILTGTTLGILLTSIPELVDQALYTRKNRIAGWIKGVRG